MAKVGEGDPRWVVQNREDGKNVNNWHWAETDCITWAKKHLTSMLSDISLMDDTKIEFCKTKKVTSVNGECTANIRKGKTIFFYELEVKVPWEGKIKGSSTISNGLITIPYISEEHDDDKMEVKVSSDTEGADSNHLVGLVQAKGVLVIQAQIAAFLKALREKFSVKRNMQSEANQTLPSYEPVKSTSTTKEPPIKAQTTKTIKLKEEFKGTALDVYNSMTNPGMVNAIMPGSVISPSEGSSFSLLGGMITGENVKLVPGTKIVQKWRFSSWPEGHFSTVTMDFEEIEEVTVLSLLQTNVPADEADKTSEGWQRNIWGRAKVMFGFGSMPFN